MARVIALVVLPAAALPTFAAPRCDHKEMDLAAQRHAASLHMRFKSRSARCDADWAVLAGDLESPTASPNGPVGVGTTWIFRRQGGRWVHQLAAEVCGTFDPIRSSAPPPDAKIPASLYFLGCLVG
jgi:hypothetical protein